MWGVWWSPPEIIWSEGGLSRRVPEPVTLDVAIRWCIRENAHARRDKYQPVMLPEES